MQTEFVLETILVFADIPHSLFLYISCVIYVCQHNCTFQSQNYLVLYILYLQQTFTGTERYNIR